VNNDWSVVLLGVIAGATLVMAIVQVSAVFAMLRVARQTQELMTSMQRDIKPLIARVQSLADEASRTVSLATAQAQKVDRLVTDLARRADETAAIVQHAIITPAREGLAIFAAVKAGLAALRGLRDLRPRHSRHAEEEDPLFIG
jgi:hypothetical protein